MPYYFWLITRMKKANGSQTVKLNPQSVTYILLSIISKSVAYRKSRKQLRAEQLQNIEMK